LSSNIKRPGCKGVKKKKEKEKKKGVVPAAK
jgi:hypothetical protein